MTEADPEADAVALLCAQLGASEVDIYVRAKCPRCRRWCIRNRWALASDCYLCTDIGGGLRFADLLLMVEFGMTRTAYLNRLEKYGPLWVAPKEWLTPRRKLRKLGLPAAIGGGVVHPD